MEISFAGKRILVTGAGRGIGRDTVKVLVKCGAKVVAVSKSKENLVVLQQEVDNVETICVDLTDWTATKNALENIGHVDGLVNNAGVALLAPFLEITPEDFDHTFAVNVKAVINVSQIISKQWIASKTGGSIVNLSSQAAMRGFVDHSSYCASKGALDALSRVMAVELGPHGIRVNCLNPTVIMTHMGRIGWADPAKADPMRNRIPLGRFGEVHEVVDAILFLLSDKASMIHGVSLPIDGGFLAS